MPPRNTCSEASRRISPVHSATVAELDGALYASCSCPLPLGDHRQGDPDLRTVRGRGLISRTPGMAELEAAFGWPCSSRHGPGIPPANFS